MAAVILCNKFGEFGGGAEKNLIEVAEHVARRHEIHFLVAGGYVDPRMLAVGKVHVMPSRGRAWMALVDAFYLVWLILRYRVRLVHAHHRYPAFLASLLRFVLPIKVLTTGHNVYPDKAGFSLWGDRVIAVSHAVAHWLRRDCGVAEDRIAVIHNGIRVPPQYGQDELQTLRREIGVPDGSTVLLSVGRLTRQKNYPLMLDALSRMKDRTDWFYVQVGEGEDRDALQARATELGIDARVRFLGLRKDVPRVMQASDVFVLSSAWEGFPYVVVEALANGLPIVSTDVGGVADAVIDGQNGYLVAPGDAAGLADKLQALIADRSLREAMSKRGKAMFAEQFQDTAMFERLDAEYARLLG
jgi:glycosyltransferase involved in cell wall biosynthesis